MKRGKLADDKPKNLQTVSDKVDASTVPGLARLWSSSVITNIHQHEFSTVSSRNYTKLYRYPLFRAKRVANFHGRQTEALIRFELSEAERSYTKSEAVNLSRTRTGVSI